MNNPKVSVIIPTYGGADHLGSAIQSVLNQTWSDFELFIVNDRSPDNTDEVVAQFNDARIRYIHHNANRGVSHARKTGLLASVGEIIVFLDQDDYFHPDKLRVHVEYLDKNPDVGFTYNSRFELFPSSGTIREIIRPPRKITLADLVLSFPLAPSVWVLRREWAFLDEIWDEKNFQRGGEIVVCGRLYLAGCKFAMVDRVLNYRRYHKDRLVKNLIHMCETERACQQIIFDDPRCTPDTLELRDVASSNIYSMWAYVAYLQGEYKTGKNLLHEAVRLNPNLLEGNPPALIHELVVDSIDDEGKSLEDFLERVFENLPEELSALEKHHSWAVKRGYLMQGVRAVLWERPVDAQEYFSHIDTLVPQIDEPFMQWLTSHLLAYESEYGIKAVMQIIRQIEVHFKKLGVANANHKFRGAYFAGKAFENYQTGIYNQVWLSAIRALVNNPSYFVNKGLISVLFQSVS